MYLLKLCSREQKAEPDDDAIECLIARDLGMFTTPQKEEADCADSVDVAVQAAAV